MRKTISLFLALFIMFASLTHTFGVSGETLSRTGDANGDGRIDTADVTAILRYILHEGTVDEEAANCDGDETVSASDATVIMKYIMGDVSFCGESQTVALKNPENEKNLILHLHRYENAGYCTVNDVYLPNAKSDFSDIRITDNNGNRLKYQLLHKSNIDVVPDDRIKIEGMIRTDDAGNFYALRLFKNKYYIAKSTDNGKTWNKVSGLATDELLTCFVVTIDKDAKGNEYMLLGGAKGILYKSMYPYETYYPVINLNDGGYKNANVLPENFAKCSNGDLIFGGYQSENKIRVFRSKDSGETWETILENSDYQHVHNISVDTNVTPEAIYVGCDGGGGVYKSTDFGDTWVNLKTKYKIPDTSDCGVIYAGDGYRLLGGETSLKGGHSIVRTTDDETFTPVLDIGNGIYYIRKLGKALIAGTTATSSHRNAMIFVSYDDGLTWEEIFSTSAMTDKNGASDGYRYLDNLVIDGTPTVLASCQSHSRKSLIITEHDEDVYAEIIVSVPKGTTSVTVTDGYKTTKVTGIYNETEYTNKKLAEFCFNDEKTVRNSVTGKEFPGEYAYVSYGKKLSQFYPNIVKPKDKKSIQLKSVGGFTDNVTIGDKFTISFWGYVDGMRLSLMKCGSNDLTFDSNKLKLNGEKVVPVSNAGVVDFVKYDLLFDCEAGTIVSYKNGMKVDVKYSSFDINKIKNAFVGEKVCTFVTPLSVNENACIQYFAIYDGIVSEKEIFQSYNGYVSDNIQ